MTGLSYTRLGCLPGESPLKDTTTKLSHVTAIMMALLLTACIASNRVRLDGDSPALVHPEAACDYRWPATIAAFYRARNGIGNPGWAYYSQGSPWNDADEVALGNWIIERIATDSGDCHTSTEAEVELAVYYADYVPLSARGIHARDLIDIVTVIGTLGTIPVDETAHYLLCMEIGRQGVAVRHALVTGRIKVDMNLWGMARQEAVSHARVREMLQVLADAAWKTLIAAAAEGEHSGCRDELAALPEIYPAMNFERPTAPQGGPDASPG